MAENERFRTVITLDITKVEGGEEGEETLYHATTVEYASLPYEGIVIVEKVLMGALAQLTDVGVAQAHAKSRGQQMDTLLKALQGPVVPPAPAPAVPPVRRQLTNLQWYFRQAWRW